VGYNYRMSNVVAGIGRGQMEVLPERVKRRREIFAFYQRAFSDIPAISFSPELSDTTGNRWLTCIVVDEAQSGGVTRETIRLALTADNIEPVRSGSPCTCNRCLRSTLTTAAALPKTFSTVASACLRAPTYCPKTWIASYGSCGGYLESKGLVFLRGYCHQDTTAPRATTETASCSFMSWCERK
jgi:dTDP-4-amino-4,6-dideoxygalactose transaminase